MKGNGFGLTNPPIESISPMDYSVKISSQKHKGKGARIYFFLNSQTLCATRYKTKVTSSIDPEGSRPNRVWRRSTQKLPLFPYKTLRNVHFNYFFLSLIYLTTTCSKETQKKCFECLFKMVFKKNIFMSKKTQNLCQTITKKLCIQKKN